MQAAAMQAAAIARNSVKLKELALLSKPRPPATATGNQLSESGTTRRRRFV
jgi:hypothetical protein